MSIQGLSKSDHDFLEGAFRRPICSNMLWAILCSQVAMHLGIQKCPNRHAFQLLFTELTNFISGEIKTIFFSNTYNIFLIASLLEPCSYGVRLQKPPGRPSKQSHQKDDKHLSISELIPLVINLKLIQFAQCLFITSFSTTVNVNH